MWQRTIEIMLAVWLSISPFIFQHPPDNTLWWYHDWIVAFLILVLASAAFIETFRFSHFLEIPIALWLIGFGWYSGGASMGAPAEQNWMIVGLLILMTAILPTDSTDTPTNWQAWYKENHITPPAA